MIYELRVYHCVPGRLPCGILLFPRRRSPNVSVRPPAMPSSPRSPKRTLCSIPRLSPRPPRKKPRKRRTYARSHTLLPQASSATIGNYL
jgi:hypothetical protein